MTPKLTTISSSSEGNSYLLECGSDKLIIELGVSAKEVLEVLDYNIQNINALCSHRHIDHAKYIPQYQKYAIPIYSCQDVAEKFEGVNMLPPMQRTKIGNFTVIPLPVPHSVENYAYFIQHPAMGKCLFMTDCYDFGYNIKGINHLFIEANYSEDLIVDRLCDGKDVRGSSNEHMEIGTTINVQKRLKSPELQTVVLLHLSAANSDERAFKERVWRECGIRCEIADKGKVFELRKEDF